MRRALILALPVLALVAACGGGGGDRLSRAELIEKASSVCTEYDLKLKALGTPENIAQLKEFGDKAKPIVRDGVDELRDLEPPEELEADYDAWVDSQESAIGLIDDLQKAAEGGDQSEVQQIAAEAEEQDARSDALARKVGLERCAQD